MRLRLVRSQGIALGLVVALGVGGWWHWVIRPHWAALASLRPKVLALRREMRETREGIDQMAQLKRTRETLRVELQALPRPLALEQMPAIMDRLAAEAKSHGVLVEAVRPWDRGNAARSAGTSRAVADAPAPDYLVIPVEIQGQAGYHELGAFLEALEQAAQLYRVRSLTIDADRRNLERHHVRVVVLAYLAVMPL